MGKGKTKEELSPEKKLEQALVPAKEQPYEVPENWCWVRLESIIELISGRDAALSECNTLGKGIPYILGASNIDNDLFAVERWIEEPQIVSERGDILFSVKGTIGKIYLQKEKQINISRQIMAIRPKRSIETKLVYWYLNKICEELRTLGNGLIPGISRNDILDRVVPLPPRAEQQRIVERIEKLFAKLDEVKEKAQESLNSYENRKTMMIHNAFEGVYTSEWRKNNGFDIENWEQLTLSDVADYKKGPFGSSITKAMFVPKGNNTYKVYEQGNAIRKTIDYGHYYIPREKYDELKGFAVQAGDIIISCAGTIGEVYKLPENCEHGVINQALMRVRIFDNIDERFFIYYFGEVLKSDVNEQANGTAIKNIPPFKIMKAMKIKLPSIGEQKEIVNLLDKVLDTEKQAKEAVEKVLCQIGLMKKSILAKAFRGELGTNNPDEESAMELLKNQSNNIGA